MDEPITLMNVIGGVCFAVGMAALAIFIAQSFLPCAIFGGLTTAWGLKLMTN